MNKDQEALKNNEKESQCKDCAFDANVKINDLKKQIEKCLSSHCYLQKEKQ